MKDVDTCGLFERLAHKVEYRSDPRRSVSQLARIAFGVIDQFLQRVGRHRWVHDERGDGFDKGGNRREILFSVVAHVLRQELHSDLRAGGGEEEVVSIGRHLRHLLGRQHTRHGRPVFKDQRLAKALRDSRAHHAQDHVGGAARGDGDDDAHRFGGEILRRRKGRDGAHQNGQNGEGHAHGHVSKKSARTPCHARLFKKRLNFNNFLRKFVQVFLRPIGLH